MVRRWISDEFVASRLGSRRIGCSMDHCVGLSTYCASAKNVDYEKSDSSTFLDQRVVLRTVSDIFN